MQKEKIKKEMDYQIKFRMLNSLKEQLMVKMDEAKQ
jgi:hypothetical protein